MALLDTPQAMMYGGNMTSQYQLMQHPYGGYAYGREYDQEAAALAAAARFNIQRIQSSPASTSLSPEFQRLKQETLPASPTSVPITVLHSSSHNTANSGGGGHTAFRPYTSPGQENHLPQHHNSSAASFQAKV